MDRVFISHSWADNDECEKLAMALRARGLDAWLDLTHIGAFEPIAPAIRQGLAGSKALVAWYSKNYPTRRACREEMTHALLAAERVDEAPLRVLVVNPERSVQHIAEARLLDRLFASRALAMDIEALADVIAARVSQVDGAFGSISEPRRVPWVGGNGWQGRVTRMVGRLSELWQIHDGLIRESVIGGPGDPGRGIVVTSGMGGMGKSLLAAEYAHLFRSAYPGGVFWLSALGNDASTGPRATSGANSANSWLASIAIHLGVSLGQSEDGHQRSATTADGADEARQRHLLVRTRIGTYLDELDKAVLWVVDDMPSGLSQVQIDEWLCPAACVRTLITTRDDRPLPFPTVTLKAASREESFQILAGDQSLRPESQRAMYRVVDWLDGYPLALAVAGAYMARMHTSGDEFLEAAGREVTTLDAMVTAVFADQLPLPGDHTSRIVATLSISLHGLDSACWDLLRIAVPLAEPGIPAWLIGQIFACVAARKVAGTEVNAAIGAANRDSLWTNDEAGVHVHAVVRQAAKSLDPDPARQDTVAQCSYRALTRYLDSVALNPYRQPLVTSVLHAHGRELIKQRPESDLVGSRSLSEYVGRIDRARGDYESCYEMYLDVYEARKMNLGPEDPLTLTAEHNLAIVSRDMGQGLLADEMTRKTLDARMRTLGPNNEDTVASQMAVANGLYAQENFADAAAAYTQAIRVLENIPITPDSARQMLMGQANLAHSLVRAGEIHEGLELHKKVLASRKRQDAPEEHVLLTESNIGYAYFMLKKYDIALRKHKRVLQRRQVLLGKTHPDTLFSMRSVAECEAALAAAGVSSDMTKNPMPKKSSHGQGPKTKRRQKKKR